MAACIRHCLYFIRKSKRLQFFNEEMSPRNTPFRLTQHLKRIYTAGKTVQLNGGMMMKKLKDVQRRAEADLWHSNDKIYIRIMCCYGM